jgi:subtilase family serine protease
MLKRNNLLTLMILFILAGTMLMSGCTPETPKPDLVPVNPEGMENFCDRDGLGNLKVHVKNQGDAPAGSSHVQVSYGQHGEPVEPVPPLEAGETVTVLFPMYSGCFDPVCEFEITVDVYDEVDESNELNNTQTGQCS